MHAVIWLGAVVFVGLICAAAVAAYRQRIGQVSRLAGPGAWAGACVDPRHPRAWRALIVDDAGLRLVSTGSRPVRTWDWDAVATVATGPVRTAGAVASHTGLVVSLRAGESVGLLLPSRSTLRYPAERLDEVVNAIRSKGPARVLGSRQGPDDESTH